MISESEAVELATRYVELDGQRHGPLMAVNLESAFLEEFEMRTDNDRWIVVFEGLPTTPGLTVTPNRISVLVDVSTGNAEYDVVL